MPLPLLKTKLSVPLLRARLVRRPHLVEKLHEADTLPLTLLSAPAGFGKTTLVSEWVAQCNQQVAWLALDEDDNDPIRFLTYLIGACQQVQPMVGATALTLLQSPQPPSNKAVLVALINDCLAQASTRSLVLTLDDYHLVTEPGIHEAVTYLVDHLPPQMHLVITTRTDPPLPLARWRARNQLYEIHTSDLRFTAEEAATFLNQTMGLKLAAADIAALEERTEGWVAGLQLAAISLQGRDDASAFIQAFSGSHRYILDYLVNEALQRQPVPMQSFLLSTSILNRLSSPLCNLLTGRTDGQTMLKQLEQANLFIVPLDEERRWYRYHHLFAEALRSRLQETMSDALPELHRRASLWYEQQGMSLEAVNHALLAPDFSRAGRLIEPIAQSMIARGETMTLLRWLQALPTEQVQTNAALAIVCALAQLIVGNFGAIEPALANAERALQRRSEAGTNQHLWDELNAIRAIIAIEQGATPEYIEQAHQTLTQLPRENLFLRGALAHSLGIAYSASGETQAASQILGEARSIGAKHNHWLTTLISSYELAEVMLEQGKLRRAQTVHQEAIAWLGTHSGGQGDQPLPLAGAAHIGLGKLWYEWNDLTMARRHLETGIELTQAQGGLGLARHGLPILALVCQAQGDRAGANLLMEQAEELAHRSPRTDAVRRLQPHKVRLWLAQGDLSAIWRWVQTRDLDPSRPPIYPLEIDYIMLARVYLAQPTAEYLTRAATLLEQALKVAEIQGRSGRLIEILMLQALVCQAQKYIDRALTLLYHSLILAEPEGYIRTFVDEGAAMRFLLLDFRLWIAGQPGSDEQTKLLTYTDKLLTAMADATTIQPAHQIQNLKSKIQNLLEPLTERELEVLRLIIAGLSNKEIADRLIIAEGTVKKYTNNIFGKLGVQRRAQAIARAGELGLV